jgi:hypothetical protein
MSFEAGIFGKSAELSAQATLDSRMSRKSRMEIFWPFPPSTGEMRNFAKSV